MTCRAGIGAETSQRVRNLPPGSPPETHVSQDQKGKTQHETNQNRVVPGRAPAPPRRSPHNIGTKNFLPHHSSVTNAESQRKRRRKKPNLEKRKVQDMILLFFLFFPVYSLHFVSRKNESIHIIEKKTTEVVTLRINVKAKDERNPAKSPCQIENNRNLDDLVHLELKKIFNSHSQKKEKKQMLAILGTALGFTIGKLSNKFESRSIETEFHTKIRNLECDLLNLGHTIQADMLNIRIREKIYSLREEVDAFKNSLGSPINTKLKEKYFEILCQNQTDKNLCHESLIKTTHIVKNEYIVIQEQESYIVLVCESTIFSKLRKTTGTFNILYNPPFLRGQHWFGTGEEKRFIISGSLILGPNTCPVFNPEKGHFICFPEQNQINFAEVQLYLSPKICFVKIIENYIIIIRPESVEGNITLLEESKRITEVKTLETKNVLQIKKRLHLRCGNLVVDLEPEDKLRVTVEISESLLAQPKALIKKSGEIEKEAHEGMWLMYTLLLATFILVLLSWVKKPVIRISRKSLRKLISRKKFEDKTTQAQTPRIIEYSDRTSLRTLPMSSHWTSIESVA